MLGFSSTIEDEAFASIRQPAKQAMPASLIS